MSDYKENSYRDMNYDMRWNLLEELYNRNYYDIKHIKNKPVKIPKVIHQIWLGSEYPEKYIKYRDLMMEINSNFEYKLWTDEDVDKFGLKNKELYYNIRNWGAKSDIFRYEILEREGGIYIDTDFLCIKPFDDLCHLDAWAGQGQVGVPEVFNSIMASAPNHKYMQNIVEGLTKIKRFDDHIPGVMNNTGPYYVQRKFYEVAKPDDNMVIFPEKFFFPFPARGSGYMNQDSEEYDKVVKSYMNENTYCIHMWHVAWQKNK